MGLCSFLNYVINIYWYALIILIVLAGIGYYLYRTFKKHQLQQYLSINKEVDNITLSS
jgi:hypothetical protein